MPPLQDHELKFVNKQPVVTPSPQPPEPTPNTLDNLKATDLVSDVVGVSVNVFVDGTKCAHIILVKVTNWELAGRALKIYSEDIVLLKLTFINASEAQTALTRFETAMNGGAI